jgi:hypothetical protein
MAKPPDEWLILPKHAGKTPDAGPVVSEYLDVQAEDK